MTSIATPRITVKTPIAYDLVDDVVFPNTYSHETFEREISRLHDFNRLLDNDIVVYGIENNAIDGHGIVDPSEEVIPDEYWDDGEGDEGDDEEGDYYDDVDDVDDDEIENPIVVPTTAAPWANKSLEKVDAVKISESQNEEDADHESEDDEIDDDTEFARRMTSTILTRVEEVPTPKAVSTAHSVPNQTESTRDIDGDWRTVNRAKPNVPRDTSRNTTKTRMCKFGESCKRRNACTYAHIPSELQPISCNFGSRCRYQGTCIFAHPGDTLELIAQRQSV